MSPPEPTSGANSHSEGDAVPPSPKKAKLTDDEKLPVGFAACKSLLETSIAAPVAVIPSSLVKDKTLNDANKLRKILDDHGFRTSIVSSPRVGVSIYKDSCCLDETDSTEIAPGKEFLVTLFGMHSDQPDMEAFYAASVKGAYCLLLFCSRLREACRDAMTDAALKRMVAETEQLCRMGSLSAAKAADEMGKVSRIASERATQLIVHAVKVDPRLRTEQLENEYERFLVRNSTLSNAHVQLFLEAHDCVIKDVILKRSSDVKHDRITICLYKPEDDEVEPPRFTFLPSLHKALTEGPESIATAMVDSFWSHLLHRGYFATDATKNELAADLHMFFLSGIASDLSVPLELNAHFTPSYPLSLYIHGNAGTGKTSLARKFSPALNSTLEQFVDPEILVRFVKQNLNKTLDTLKLELELRPNNNDLSVMSIIQGRRMTMGQSKPGLVVVDLEEMASTRADADPNQLDTAQLISQRFSGRNGDYTEGQAPRNSAKRSISGDASLISIFTSNYPLEKASQQALTKLEMFENLTIVEMKSVSGADRKKLAFAYLEQTVKDHYQGRHVGCQIDIDIPLEDGDTRPLVRHLRMLSFYLCDLVPESMLASGTIVASIVQNAASCKISVEAESIQLKLGTNDLLFPVTPQTFDRRTSIAIDGLRTVLGEDQSLDYSELSIIVDFWLSGTLAPTVIVSKDAAKVKCFVAAMGALYDAYHIPRIDSGKYKMMKSLYDGKDTPNLRDDLLRAGAGKGGLVAIELVCEDADAQHCVREMIEGTPSMTAFSTEKSALQKAGLLFGVFVNGEITPEVASRATLIL